MSRPRDPNMRRVESSTYKLGYAIPLGGQWVIRVSTLKRATGLRDTDENIPAVRELIDHHVKAWMSNGALSKGAIESKRTVPSLYKACGLWWGEHVKHNPQVSEARKAYIKRQIELLTPKGKDMPLGTDSATLSRLVERLSAYKADRARSVATATLLNEISLWKRLFAWLEGMDWIRKNPVDQLSIPKLEKKNNEEKVYTPEELRNLFGALRETDQELYLLCLWLRYTGMRIHEALDMRFEDFQEGTLLVRGKGTRNQKNLRRIPLYVPKASDHSKLARWQRLLWSILNRRDVLYDDLEEQYLDAVGKNSLRQVLRYRKQRTAQGYLWRWATQPMIRRKLVAAMQAGGVEKVERRAFKGFRALAEHYLLHTIGLDEQYVLRIIGHTKAVHSKEYKLVMSPKDTLSGLGLRENDIDASATKRRQNVGQNIPADRPSILQI